jgi:hypothetical protein
MSDTHRNNVAVIDALLDAYNAGDARRFAEFFAEDAVHGVLHSDQYLHGRDAIHARYVEVFAMYPQNRSVVVNRMALGPFVLDHEKVSRSPDSEPFEVVVIYTFDGGLIKRMDFVRT